MVEIEQPQTNPNVEKLKLFANTNSKGNTVYSWEIQLLGIDIERLDKLNAEMVKKYGNMLIV